MLFNPKSENFVSSTPNEMGNYCVEQTYNESPNIEFHVYPIEGTNQVALQDSDEQFLSVCKPEDANIADGEGVPLCDPDTVLCGAGTIDNALKFSIQE